MDDFLRNKSTKEFIDAIGETENLNTRNIVLSRKGKNGGTWMRPPKRIYINDE